MSAIWKLGRRREGLGISPLNMQTFVNCSYFSMVFYSFLHLLCLTLEPLMFLFSSKSLNPSEFGAEKVPGWYLFFMQSNPFLHQCFLKSSVKGPDFLSLFRLFAAQFVSPSTSYFNYAVWYYLYITVHLPDFLKYYYLLSCPIPISFIIYGPSFLFSYYHFGDFSG